MSPLHDNLVAYAKLKFAEPSAEIAAKIKRAATEKERAQLIEEQDKLNKFHKQLLQEIDAGMCFGASIVHAAMDISGQLTWWEATLRHIINWDQRAETLKQEIRLPGKLPLAETPENRHQRYIKEQNLLEHAFERALEYIGFHHSLDIFSTDMLLPISQDTILDPEGMSLEKSKTTQSYLELLDTKGHILTIQQQFKMGGFLTEETLLADLEHQSLDKCIILASNSDHTIRIQWADPTCLVYDMRYHSREPGILHKTFSKQDCIKEIFNLLGHQGICVEIASFDSTTPLSFPHYMAEIEDEPINLMQEMGFWVLAEIEPDYMVEFLQQRAPRAEIYELLQNIQKKFTNPYFYNQNALSSLATMDIRILPALLLLAKKSPLSQAINENMWQAMGAKNSKNDIALHNFALFAPQNIIPLFEFLIVADTDPMKMFLFLFDKNEEGQTPWSLLNDTNKADIFNFLFKKFSGVNYDFYKSVATMGDLSPGQLLHDAMLLEMPSQSIKTAFQSILLNNPSVLPAFFNFMQSQPNGFNHVLNLLLTEDSHEKTYWAKLPPLVAKQILGFLFINIEHMHPDERESKQNLLQQLSFALADTSKNSFFRAKKADHRHPLSLVRRLLTHVKEQMKTGLDDLDTVGCVGRLFAEPA